MLLFFPVRVCDNKCYLTADSPVSQTSIIDTTIEKKVVQSQIECGVACATVKFGSLYYNTRNNMSCMLFSTILPPYIHYTVSRGGGL